MSHLEENIVREFFDQNGFLIRSLRRAPTGGGRKKAAGGEVDLLVSQPFSPPPERLPGFFIFPNELPFIRQAVILMRGLHALSANPIPRTSAQIHRFIEQSIVKNQADDALTPYGMEGETEWLRILVLPNLPTAEPFRTQSTRALQSIGVHGIISFRGMLTDLVIRLEAAGPPPHSIFLQTVRLLKTHDLIRDAQLELFPDRKP